ncbi:hypothetical protein ACQPX6_04110 [Actinomycetospora sp. CA-101289]|uniref:hypothetical protein n=1 Tax=Actinomycetospora sp. CA-101289 TaxID=3239893 RepID=UPI003D95F05F
MATTIPVGVPGPVTAARVLVVLSGVGGLLWGVFGVAGGLFALSLSRSAGVDGDALGSSEMGAYGVATVGELAVFGVVAGVLSVVLAIVDFVCATRIGRGSRGARWLLTGTVLADLVLGVVLGTAVDPTFLPQLVISVPWAALVLGLLWLTGSARRFFGDEALPRDAAPGTPVGLSTPFPVDPPTSPLGLLVPADVVVPAQHARFCSRCGQPRTPAGAFCGGCGASLRNETPAVRMRG